MDSISHMVTGAALSTLKTGSLNFQDPRMIGCLIGALSPDFDIITYFSGHERYLKWHRGFTHSIPGLLLQNIAITSLLKYIFRSSSIIEIFIWTLLGLSSHIFLDVLNSYGIRLWPQAKKVFFDILPLFDPILIALFGLAIVMPLPYTYIFMGLAFLIYPLVRIILRRRSRLKLQHQYQKDGRLDRLMPATTHPLKWDFIISTPQEVLRGQLSNLKPEVNIQYRFKKLNRNHPVVHTVYQSKLGHYFDQFTPLSQPVIKANDTGYEITLYDLRYLKQNAFLHSGTAYLNKQLEVKGQYLHPHSPAISINMDKRIKSSY